MTPRTLIILCIFFTCCDNNTIKTQESHPKIIIIPDTANNWYAKLFDFPYYQMKNETCNLLGLPLLENDTSEFVVRVWRIASSYNPQKIYLLRKIANTWTLSMVRYYQHFDELDRIKIDSISLQKDDPKVLTSIDIEKLDLRKLWEIPTQSKMKDGGSYGCVDGYSLLIEISDRTKYKYTFHICPAFHASKDSTFMMVDQFDNKLKELANR